MGLSLKIINKSGYILSEDSGFDFVDLVYSHAYEPGDQIILTSGILPVYVRIQLDDGIGEAFVYLTGDLVYPIPMGEGKANLSPKAFEGQVHYLFAEVASEKRIQSYGNLACNPYDIPGTSACYPHAWANVETRNESVFAARCAIDGLRANLFHGIWPYTSLSLIHI